MTASRTSAQDSWGRFAEIVAAPRTVVLFWTLHGLAYVAVFLTLYPTVAHVDSNSIDIMQRHLAIAYQFTNPPLYEWLLWAVQQMAGEGRAAPLILRYLLMTGIGLTVWGLVRDLTGSRMQAAAASYALQSFYWFAWFFHEAASHSIVVALLGTLMLWAITRFVRRPTWAGGALIGLAVGFGLVAKFNFAILIAASLVAAATDRRLRTRLLDRRLLPALPIAAVIVGPVVVGVAALGRDVMTSAALVLTRGDQSHLVRALTGVVRLPVSLVLFLSPWIAIAGGLWGPAMLRSRGAASAPDTSAETPDAECFLLRLAATAVLLAFAGVLVVGVSTLSERYMLPIALPAILAFHVTPARRIRPERLVGCFAGLAAVVLVVCLLVRIAAGLTGGVPERRDNKRLDPYDALAAEFDRRGFAGSFFITPGHYESGNLAAALPTIEAAGIDSQRTRAPISYPAEGRCILVFKGRFETEATGRSEEPPEIPKQMTPFVPPAPRIETIRVPWRPTLLGPARTGVFHLIDLGRDARACRDIFGAKR